MGKRRMRQRTLVELILSDKHDEARKAISIDTVNSQSITGMTPLIAAVQRGNQALVVALLTAGATVNAQGPNESTALLAAAYCRDAAMCLLLLRNGADKYMRDTWNNNVIDEVREGNKHHAWDHDETAVRQLFTRLDLGQLLLPLSPKARRRRPRI